MRMYNPEWEAIRDFENASNIRDAGFGLCTGELPADHGVTLFEALLQHLPWLAEVPGLGVHPIHGEPTGRDDHLIVNRRIKLVLRLPTERLADAQALVGKRIDPGAGPLTLGPLKERLLTPFGTLYSHFVVGDTDEARFLAEASSQLKAMGIECEMICGKQRNMAAPAGEAGGYSLMLHGLSPAQSILVQEQGLGIYREYGCGLFIPHKSIKEVAAN